jgi:ribosomal-protein-serine acetyltransferase
MNIPIIVRNGLELRRRTEADAEAVFQSIDRNREYLKQWLPWLDDSKTVEDLRKYIQNDIAEFEKKEGCDFGIWYEGQWIGGIGFSSFGTKDRKTSIGYWLSEDFQGKGIMTDCVRALVNYGFEHLNLNRIVIRAAARNTKSRAIPERLGFKEEGILRQSEWLYDHFVDLVMYSLLREEWSEKRETIFCTVRCL